MILNMFPEHVRVSAITKQEQIIDRLQLSGYLDTDVPTQNYAGNRITREYPPSYKESRLRLATELRETMTHKELTYGYLATENPALSQAYNIAVDREQLNKKPLGAILGIPYSVL